MRVIAINAIVAALFLVGAALLPQNAAACDCCVLVVNCTVTPSGSECHSFWVCN